ncbi:MAG: hypothetical protein HXX18_04565 [Bacteroidetes bacterium]|nr:hypothetical protein [Bacteroidota bacterium]
MNLNIYLLEDFSIFKLVHILISITFLMCAVWLFIRSFRGIFNNRPYIRIDKLLSIGFIITLYLQLFFGIILFSNLGSNMGYNYLSIDNTVKVVSKRLWPIEHIVLMLFALLIASLGLYISLNTQSDKRKYWIIIIYYSISLLLIFFSLSGIYFF